MKIYTLHAMKNVPLLISLLLISSVLISGCLETKEAKPALVDRDTLHDLGWVQSGQIQKDSLKQEIGGLDIVINTAVVNYYDEEMSMDIKQQIEDFYRRYGGSASGEEEEPMASQFVTMRLTLPAGITIPESVLFSIIDKEIQHIAQENNIDDFFQSGDDTVIISSGSKVKARSYEGYIRSENSEVTISVRGIIATWGKDGATTVVIGIIPNEDIIIHIPTQLKSSGSISIKIDEDREYQEILTLIEHVE